MTYSVCFQSKTSYRLSKRSDRLNYSDDCEKFVRDAPFSILKFLVTECGVGSSAKPSSVEWAVFRRFVVPLEFLVAQNVYNFFILGGGEEQGFQSVGSSLSSESEAEEVEASA